MTGHTSGQNRLWEGAGGAEGEPGRARGWLWRCHPEGHPEAAAPRRGGALGAGVSRRNRSKTWDVCQGTAAPRLIRRHRDLSPNPQTSSSKAGPRAARRAPRPPPQARSCGPAAPGVGSALSRRRQYSDHSTALLPLSTLTTWQPEGAHATALTGELQRERREGQ